MAARGMRRMKLQYGMAHVGRINAKMRHSSLWLNGRRNFRPVVRWSRLKHGLNSSIAGTSIPKTDIGMWKPMSRFW